MLPTMERYVQKYVAEAIGKDAASIVMSQSDFTRTIVVTDDFIPEESCCPPCLALFVSHPAYRRDIPRVRVENNFFCLSCRTKILAHHRELMELTNLKEDNVTAENYQCFRVLKAMRDHGERMIIAYAVREVQTFADNSLTRIEQALHRRNRWRDSGCALQ